MAVPEISASFATAVTPADGTDLPNGKAWGLWIGVGGTLSFDCNGINLSTTVPAGLFQVSTTRVRATGTAATGILALYG